MKRDFAQRSLIALKWNYLGSFSRSGLQFLMGIILARLLGPQPFGLMAIGITVIGFGTLISEFGLGSALIQRKEVNAEDIRFVFTMQIAIGMVFSVTVFLLAEPIGTFFHHKGAVPIVQALSPLFLINTAGQTANALLRRELNFKAAQLAQFGSYVVGYVVVGIPLAFWSRSVWSLVIAQVIQSLIYSFALYGIVRHPVAPCFKNPGNGLFDFGMKITASNIATWAFTSIDNIIIGRAFSVTDMGLYNRVSVLMSNPVGIIVTGMQGVLFSTSARIQNDLLLLRRTYLAVLGAMGFVCFPIFFTVVMVPETVINGIYGDQWIAAAPLLVPLALVQPTYALLALGASVLTGIGKAGQEMWVQFVALSLLVLALWLATYYSVVMIAWSVLAVYLVRLALISGVTLRAVGAGWRSAVAALAGPAVLGVITALAGYGADMLAGHFLTSPLLRLSIVVFTAFAVSLLVFSVLGRHLATAPVQWLMDELAPRLPKPIRLIFQRHLATPPQASFRA